MEYIHQTVHIAYFWEGDFTGLVKRFYFVLKESLNPLICCIKQVLPGNLKHKVLRSQKANQNKTLLPEGPMY